MANYNREEMEKQGNASVGVAVGTLGTLLGLAGFIGKAVLDGKKQQNIETQIADKNQQINELRSSFLGSIRYSDQISKLEQERNELIKKR